ncbi:hypothetical protein ROTAS13_03500 [Roseomonas sp. TAS13]|nr:hypothetical protein ROTAS13_03500 [Roseomonas sp. TAS13]
MIESTVTAAGRFAGEFAAGRLGDRLQTAFETGKGISGPLGRALLDAFMVDRLVGTIWPSLLPLAFMLVLHTAAATAGLPEAERILAGLAVGGTLLWSAYAIVAGGRAAWPCLRVWWVTRQRPREYARMMIFHTIRDWWQQTAEPEMSGDGTGVAFFRSAFTTLQARLDLTPDRVACEIASHLAPILVRHLLSRLAMIVVPVLIALLYYRFAVYPDLVEGSIGVGPWRLALYPFAALADAVSGSALRSALLLRG